MLEDGSKMDISSYVGRSSKSKKHMESAKKVLPGGLTANIKHFDPYPLCMSYADGSRLFDNDGHTYIDYLMGYGALMLGHGHPYVREAIINQMDQQGTWLFGTPHDLEVKFAERIQRFFPSMEQIRYTNSGTEAVLLALRLAMAYKKKYKVAKFEGHYHGSIDSLLISVNPPLAESGLPQAPKAISESGGADESHTSQTVVLPFNDIQACKEILETQKDELAAVIIEPIAGGIISPEKEFLSKLRKLTNRLGILLIFDEVKTAFRTDLSGAQGLFNVKPDLTAIGKVVGGGFPFGLVGGRKAIMEQTSPLKGSDSFASPEQHQKQEKALFHSGTYNGHPMILSAGMATLDILEKEFEPLQQRTEAFKKELERLFERMEIPMQAIGIGAMFSVLLTEMENVRNYRDLQEADGKKRAALDSALFMEGIYTKPGNRYSLSVVHSEEDIAKTLAAYEKVLPAIFKQPMKSA